MVALASEHVNISTLLVKNIHCPSCVSYAQDVLRHIPQIHQVDISLIEHTVRVQHEGDIDRQIARELADAAFEVDHVSVTDISGRKVRSYSIKHASTTLPPPALNWRILMSKSQRRHFENCDACREERGLKAIAQHTWQSLTKKRRLDRAASVNSHTKRDEESYHRPAWNEKSLPLDMKQAPGQDNDEGLYTATILIKGMTCASCVATVNKELQEIPWVESVSVNLLANNAKVTYRGLRSKAEDLLEAIEDVGFEAELDATQSVKKAVSPKTMTSWRALLSVEGMTCGSCVGTITRGLEELSFVTSVNVDLVGNSASVWFEKKEGLDNILEKIGDLGYDASLVNIEESGIADVLDATSERTIEIQVIGMYCSNCPTMVVQAIREKFPDRMEIVRELSNNSPRIKLTYKPLAPEMTVRSIIRVINSVDAAFTASVYHPPSLEERSRDIQRGERNRVLRHLLFTLLAAVPSFIIGVVYMSLVSNDNRTKRWFEEPIWAGSAMRMDWALFITTTPVMFYGAKSFHTRALKGIWSLWGPKSRTPILRRFYRFGSMNLLISAGTSVAYFASLAVLIMDATTPTPQTEGQTSSSMDARKSTTYFDTVTFLTLFILCGRFLEAYSKAKTGDAVSMLSNLKPRDALVIETSSDDGGHRLKSVLKRVPVDLLEVGDTVSIPRGVCPPTDGVIDQEGTFLFDESSLTGESKPVTKRKGDKVYIGSVNVADPVRILVTEVGGKSMLDQIVNVVREGQAKRAPIERVADILTGYFAPIITLLAILTWIIWLALGESGALPQAWLDVNKGGWPFWSVEFAIAVFVVACPCGIGLAAPTALFVGGGMAAKQGILVQGGGEAFQEASKLDIIVFDKTGTLTEGKMRVTDIKIIEEKSHAIALPLARMLEESSSHPIAKAIVDYCNTETPCDKVHIQGVDLKEVPGQGMTGTFEVDDGLTGTITYEAVIGNEGLLKSSNITQTFATESDRRATLDVSEESQSARQTLEQALSQFQSSGCSTAIIAIRQKNESGSPQPFEPAVIFAITDPIRPEAPSVLNSLRSRGVSVHMCTGDNQTTAQAIASQLDIPTANIRAGVLPQDKAAYIRELQYPNPGNLTSSADLESQTRSKNRRANSKRKVVAFVGDGTNDTPALTTADVSIAMSHSTSSDIAMTSSSFILINSSLTSILTLVTLSRRVFLRVKLNFAWAAVYNIVLIPVAAGVFFAVGANEMHGGFRLSPVWASAAMAGSSVSVVLSSLALRLPEVRVRELFRARN